MKIAICAIIKDENLYLREWIEWHLKIGINAIYLYEDTGSESHQDIVDCYDEVFLTRSSENTKLKTILSNRTGSTRQWNLYRAFAEKYKGEYDWIAFIDIDEFIMLEDGYSLEQMNSEYGEYPALLIAWKMINATGHISRPKGHTTDVYTEEGDLIEGDKCWCSKSFVNTKHYIDMKDLHHAVGAVNVDFSSKLDVHIHKKIWLNHYFTKSWEDWCYRIFKRGNIFNGFRTIEQFFECNPNMSYLKEILIDSVSDKIPTGGFWANREKRTIQGGNVKAIYDLNHPRNGKLVFDLGFYNGDTSSLYLNNGYTVVGVECNPNEVEKVRTRFYSELQARRLILVDMCISEKGGDEIPFYLSTKDVWSSAHREIAEREEKSEEIRVKTITLPTLIEIYGCPDYCKIDIEGNDVVALKTLHQVQERPKYISCETECIGANQKVTSKRKYAVLDELKSLGYTKFHLEKQPSDIMFTDISDWVDYDAVKKEIKDKHKGEKSYHFWYDVYATY